MYASLVGSLMYAALGTRPDIMFAVVALSRYNTKATEAHWNAGKRVLRYLKDLRLLVSCIRLLILCYVIRMRTGLVTTRTDALLVGTVSCCLVGLWSWQSKKQDTVALSSTEAEYMAVTPAAKELIWLDRLLADFKIVLPKPLQLFEDNQACIALSKNPELHKTSKHIAIRHHFIRQHCQRWIGQTGVLPYQGHGC